jgi:hypothetical protein
MGAELKFCSSQDFSEYPYNHYETLRCYLLRVFTLPNYGHRAER